MKSLKLFVSAVIISSLTLLPIAASAQNAGKVVQAMDLGSENLDGELMGPNGDFMSGRKISIMNSLIQFRDNFIKEMIKSAEDL
jgi:hypothetical protein